MPHLVKWTFVAGIAAFTLSGATALAADPPPPSGGHPRLFLNEKVLSALTEAARTSSNAAAQFGVTCQQTIDKPMFYVDRGGADGSTWPNAAMNCAFSYLVTKNAAHLTQAIKYWIAAMEDDQKLGDKLGCTANVNPSWQAWKGQGAAPPVIITVTHDTGYPMRWYGPYVALTYDWLHDAPGVSEALRAQTRMCLQSWVDYYTKQGYHREEPGSNYNAGYVAGKTFTAIAIAGENGAEGDRLWTEAINEVFRETLIGKGLAGMSDPFGKPAGAMVGGDWGEGWQYGPLSVQEYAIAARTMEENGVALPEMDAWTNSLITRYLYATLPQLDGHYVGGDFEDGDRIYAAPNAGVLDAVIAGPSSDSAAAWAKQMMAAQKLNPSRNPYLANVLAEARPVTAQDFHAQDPAPPLWYLARGTRVLYVRNAWAPDAFWGTFQSAPAINSDHHHYDASNFVFTRGADHLVVDPSDYGTRSTLPSNALTADSAQVKGDYARSQTPWSKAELVWARGTANGVYAARGDIAKAFIFSSTPSDIPYAHREWTFLPEGEVVIIDRVRTGDAAKNMYVNIHTNTKGTLKIDGAVALGTVGGSQLAIHAVVLSGGTPAVVKPMVASNCYIGTCDNVRFAVDEYVVKVPGPLATAIHVLDGLAGGEERATVGSLTDATYDPDHTNTAIIGAGVYRASKQSYVVASSADNGAAGDSLAYSVPGGSAGRHIVFDAPEDGDGKSMVTAAVDGARCAITIGAGAGFDGRPLMFQVTSVADGCKASEDTAVASGAPPPGGGSEVTTTPGGGTPPPGAGGTPPGQGGGASLTGGCGCLLASGQGASAGWLLLALGVVVVAWRRRRL